jgi:hypothetical protein
MRVAGGIADLLGFIALDGAGGTAPRAKARRAGRRLGALPPVRPRSVDNPARLASLIVVAAALLDSETKGAIFTFDQLVNKMREVLGRPGDIDIVGVQAMLPHLSYCLASARSGWRWKSHRGPTYLG